MLDFTSALYLGIRHASGSLRPWAQLTLGVPAALKAPPHADAVADRLAHLIGCERATLGTSTLHLFWDLFGLLSSERIAIYVDAGTYPIARWGVERALARGALVHGFAHHNVAALRQALARDERSGCRPFVVTDGFCPVCGHHAPLRAYLDSVREYGGRLIIDDTQALGIFGHSARARGPYGKSGGGSLQWWGIDGEDVILIASLAKGFGVPLAAMAGSHTAIDRFEQRSETRVHCSPPSVAVIHAVEHALDVNEARGDLIRLQLARHVQYFHSGMRTAGLTTTGGLFPVQTLIPAPDLDATRLYERLLQLGIQTILHPVRNGRGTTISFIITARHPPEELGDLVDALASATARSIVR